jgi:amino acid adenylation domain-containing protein
MINKFLGTDKTVMHKICTSARESPNSIALLHNGTEVSYYNLLVGIENISNIIYNHINRNNEIIAIPAIHNINMIVSLLGINYSGNAYLPLNPNWTIEKTIKILKESKSSILIYDKSYHFEYINELRQEQFKDVKFIAISNEIFQYSNFDLSLSIPKSKPEFLAYVLYTSGSTGDPKGVLQKNDSVYNLIEWACNQFAYPKPIVAGITRLTFDLSVLDIFTALSAGGIYQILDESDIMNPAKLIRHVYLTKCNFLQTVPSVWARIINYLSQKNEKDTQLLTKYLKNIVLAGEPLYKSLVKDSFTIGFDKSLIWNMYGPTETIHVTANMINSEKIKNTSEEVPLGDPIKGVKLHIADENGTFISGPCTGEIHIGGICVSPGYINNQDMDLSGFYKLSNNENWYKTGDFAKRTVDGSLIYIGRKDDQIKIAGKRVYLSEIEKTALNCPQVKQAAAIYHKSSQQLILYVVLNDRNLSNIYEIKEFIIEKSESYAIPNKIEAITKLPLTNNGKIDRNSLLQLNIKETKKRRVNITADRWFFVLNEERKTTQEHPQINFILPFTLNKEYLIKRLNALIQSIPYLRLYGDSGLDNSAYIFEEVNGEVCAKALVDFGEKIKFENIISLIRMIGDRPLKFINYPNFLLGYGALINGSSFISFRCHHAIASGTDVIYWISLLLRGFNPCKEYKVKNSFIWSENSSFKKFKNGIKLGDSCNKDEKRIWIHIPNNIFFQLEGLCKSKNITLPILLFAIHAKIINQIFGSTIIEMPLLRKIGSKADTIEIDETLNLNAIMKNIPIPSKLEDINESIKWAIKCIYSNEEVTKKASHRWNLIPVSSFMSEQHSKLSLIPLDLYEQLPPLNKNNISSILTQFYRGEIFYVIRMQYIDKANIYANEIINHILKLLNEYTN